MSYANMLRGYSLKKSPLNIQNAKDYEGAERTIQDDEGNSEDWWGEYQNPIHNELSTVHTHTHHYMLHGLRPLRIPW